MDYFSSLPHEVNVLIRGYLSLTDIMALTASCRLQRTYTYSNFSQLGYTANIYTADSICLYRNPAVAGIAELLSRLLVRPLETVYCKAEVTGSLSHKGVIGGYVTIKLKQIDYDTHNPDIPTLEMSQEEIEVEIDKWSDPETTYYDGWLASTNDVSKAITVDRQIALEIVGSRPRKHKLVDDKLWQLLEDSSPIFTSEGWQIRLFIYDGRISNSFYASDPDSNDSFKVMLDSQHQTTTALYCILDGQYDFHVMVHEHYNGTTSNLDYHYKDKVLIRLDYADITNGGETSYSWILRDGLSVVVLAHQYIIPDDGEAGYQRIPVADRLKRKFTLDDTEPQCHDCYSFKLPGWLDHDDAGKEIFLPKLLRSGDITVAV